MTWILVIGPTKWSGPYRPSLPERFGEMLPRTWKRRGLDVLAPIDIRALLAGMLRREGAEATLMEDDSKRKGETNTGHFIRLVSGHPRGRFFAYWPKNANWPGLNWEFSHLGTRIEEGRLAGEQLHLFPEEGIAEFDIEGDSVIFLEGNPRTTYFDDFAKWGCGIDIWTSHEELVEKVLEAGTGEPPVTE